MDQPANNLLSGKIKILDGFRGLAIILVCCYHYLHPFLFGWVGVDLFFVLSGFLITGKLVESLGSKHYFRSFFAKRILRILPLFYSVLLLFFVLLPWLLPSYVSGSFKELVQHQIYYWSFTVNIADAINGWPKNITLIHFWSLACEMQFYLCWPFVVYFFGSKAKNMVALCIVFCLLGILFRVFGHLVFKMNGIYRYVLLPCRIDAFCAGAILYFSVRGGKLAAYYRKLIVVSLVVLCVVLLIMAIKKIQWHFGIDTVSKYGYTLNAIFWSTLLGFTLSTRLNLWKRVFTGKLITSIGKYSYGIYVFHLPIFIIIAKQCVFNANTNDRTWQLAAVAFVISCLCSVASYHLVEKHFLKLKPTS